MGCLSPVRLLALVALLGCERADPATPAKKTVTIRGPKLTVVLRDPGVEPRSVLRIRATPGSQHYEYVVTTTDAWEGQPAGRPNKMTMHEERKVDEVRPDGSFHAISIWRELAFEGDNGAEMTKQLQPMIDAEFAAWVDGRSNIIGDIALTVDENAKTSESMEGNPEGSSALPVEAVGIGARWDIEVQYAGESASIRAQLTRHEGEAIDLATEFTHRGGPYNLDATGRGEIHFELAGGPSWGTLHERGTMRADGHTLVRETTKTSRKLR